MRSLIVTQDKKAIVSSNNNRTLDKCSVSLDDKKLGPRVPVHILSMTHSLSLRELLEVAGL